MEEEYYPGGEDGGATPVQDEHESGSDEQEDFNENHAASEGSSVGHHSEDEGHKEYHSDGEDSNISEQPDSREEKHMTSDSENDEPKKAQSCEQSDDEVDSDKGNHSIHEDSGGEHEESHERMNYSDSEKNGRISQKLESRGASDDDDEEPTLHKPSNSDEEQDEENGDIAGKRKKAVLSDSEDEKEAMNKSAKKSRIASEGEDSDNDSAIGKTKHSVSGSEDSDSDSGAPKNKHMVSGGEDSDSNTGTLGKKMEVSRGEDSDSDAVTPKKKQVVSEAEDSNSDAGSSRKKQVVSGAEDSDSDPGISKKKKRLDLGDEDSDSDGGISKQKPVFSDREESDSDTGISKTKRVVSDVDSDSDVAKKKQVASDAEDSDSDAVTKKKQVFSDGDDSDSDTALKKKNVVSEDEESADSDSAAKKTRILSAAEDSDSDAASEKRQSKPVLSDSDEDEENKEPSKKNESGLFGSDSESEDEGGVGTLIADIFGESDDEGEEFTGFNQEDLDGEKAALEAEKKMMVAEESDSDSEIRGKGRDLDFVSDFEMMLQKKKDQNRKRRRNRDGGTFISDADDVVSAMITKMNEAAVEDQQLNGKKKPALKKLTLLPTVVMHLKKQDLKDTFIDSGVMSAIKEWLTPLPDKSLPHLKIREELLKILQELPSVSQETLKHSGIGRCVMYLYKHPKESRGNKELAGKLINEWSRPIFGLTSNYKGMTREEREQRDLDQMPTRRRLSSLGGQTPRRDLDKVLTGEEKALRPGDPGFCARARVPLPSNRDYVVRPKWNVEIETSRHGSTKKPVTRLEKHKRVSAEKRRLNRMQGAVKFSIDGNHMPL
ncbi:protein IWS1 homolog isoform X3 [Callorhinchus milii]|nr:protein IWS1 homolog isoform X3 [Callorhinchus milii]